MKEVDLKFTYGEVDLSWIISLSCPALIVSLVKHTCEEKSLTEMKIHDIFKEAGREEITLEDDDVEVSTYIRRFMSSIYGHFCNRFYHKIY
jgi:hypothetical protein